MNAVWPLLALAVAAGLLVLMARARRLEDRHAVLWLTMSALAAAALAASGAIAEALGASRTEVALAVGLVVTVALLLAAYAVIARLAHRSRVLAQRLALLEERNGSGGAAGSGGTAGGAG